MNKILAAFMLILLLSSYGHASQSTISLGEGYACMGDSRSRKQTEEQALLDAKRNSVEKVRTYLTSETTIKDFKLESDVIRAYADASVKIVEVIKKEWYKDPSRGECYKTDIKVEVVPDESVLSKIAETAGTADDPTGPLNVKIWTDKKTYKDCDKIKVFLKGNKPFYARVVYRDASGELIQILPNRYRADNYFHGNVVYEIPSGPDKFELALSPPYGNEQVKVFASTGELGDISLSDDKDVYKVLTKEADLGVLARSIKIKQKSTRVPVAEFTEHEATISTEGSCSSTEVSRREASNDVEMVVQSGHTGHIEDLVFSPDNKYYVTSSADGMIKWWRVSDGLLIRTMKSNASGIETLVISPDGKILASCFGDSNIRLWDFSSGTLIRTIQALGFANRVAFSPDGKYLASAAWINLGDDAAMKVWRVSDGTLVQSFSRRPENWMVRGLAFSPDGTMLATLNDDAGITLWKISDTTVRWSQKSGCGCRKMTFSSDGLNIICVSAYSASVINSANGSLLRSIGEPYSDAAEGGSAVSANGRYVAIHQRNGHNQKKPNEMMTESISMKNVEIRQVLDGKVVQTTDRFVGISAFSGDGEYLAGSDRDGGTGILNISEGRIISRVMTGLIDTNGVTGLAVEPTGEVLVAAYGSNNLALWSLSNLGMVASRMSDLKSSELQDELSPVDDTVSAGIARLFSGSSLGVWTASAKDPSAYKKKFAFSPDGKFVGFTTNYDTVKIGPISNDAVRHTVTVKGTIIKIAFSADGHYIAIAVNQNQQGIASFGDQNDRSEMLTLWRVADGTRVPFYKNGHKWITDFIFSKNGKFMAVAGEKSTDIVSLPDGRMLKTIPVSERENRNIDVSPDGKYIAGVGNNSIKLWNIADGSVVRTYERLYTPFALLDRAIVFSRDGKHLFVGDVGIKIFNVSSGAQATILKKGGEWVLFTPDGYFDSSRNGGSLVAMAKGLDIWAIDQFALRNNRPDIILKKLGIGSQELIDHYRNQYAKRLQKAGFTEEQLSAELHVPEAFIVHAKQDGKFIDLTFTLSDSKYNLKKYNIYINNIPLYGAYGREVDGNKCSLTERAELTSGKNKIEISALNEKGAESYRALSFAEYNKKGTSDLYFIGFGVSRYKNKDLDLRYADKDVKDMAALYERMKGNLYNSVFVKTYVNEEVTPERFRTAKDFIKTAKADDTVVLFIAGHGVHERDSEATYYFLTHNADLINLKETAMDFYHIEDLLQGIASRNKLFLMDTCESGEIEDSVQERYYAMADSRGIRARAIRGVEVLPKTGTDLVKVSSTKRKYLLQRDHYIYNDLSRRSGAIVFSSSRGEEFSYESDKVQNGLFTRAIINAYTREDADKNHDGIVSIDELRDYVGKAVSDQTNGLQNPTVDRDNLYQKFGFPAL